MTSSGCKAVDVSRSCFECWRNHPEAGGLVPRRGSYYFLDQGVQFLQRSNLGGWWFEGRGHFQEGSDSTLSVPDPFWVNGAIPAGLDWPAVHCCRLLFPDFTPTRAAVVIERVSDGARWEVDADTVAKIAGTYIAEVFSGGVLRDNFALPCNPVFPPGGASTCAPPSYDMTVFRDPTINDPAYQISQGADSVAAWAFLDGSGQCVVANVRVDWFGTVP